MKQAGKTAPDRKQMDISDCRLSREGAGVATCLVNKTCRWAVPFLNLRYCTNPAMLQIPAMAQRKG